MVKGISTNIFLESDDDGYVSVFCVFFPWLWPLVVVGDHDVAWNQQGPPS